MKYSDIYCLDDKGVKQAINHLNQILPFKLGQKGDQVPLPRDGHSMNLYDGNKLVVFGGDNITEINSVEEKKPTIINNDVIYNLNGQVVTNPSKGIYIKNGKKFIVK